MTPKACALCHERFVRSVEMSNSARVQRRRLRPVALDPGLPKCGRPWS